jgi:hypothetical protein
MLSTPPSGSAAFISKDSRPITLIKPLLKMAFHILHSDAKCLDEKGKPFFLQSVCDASLYVNRGQTYILQ